MTHPTSPPPERQPPSDADARPPLDDDVARVRVFPPLVFVGAGLAGVGLTRLWPLPWPVPMDGPILSRLGPALMLVAGLLILWAIWGLQRSGQDPSPHKPTPEIVTSGPFRISRNPIYLGMVLLLVGLALHRLDLWLLLITPMVVVIFQAWVILPEEEYLERRFGDVYRSYKAQARRWL